ncbi:hypothetical protein SATMO3_21640 [Sporomusa aerivorans]
MWAIVNSEGTIIATINVLPSIEDLETRNETFYECNNNVTVGEKWDIISMSHYS